MLASLYISNYILIENQEIEFQNGFTVITGETGAGKSILINALNLILGSRPKGDIHRDKNRKAIFEAIFTGLTIPEAFFQEHDLDYDKTLIIRREILPGGKSRLFINDTPVNISVVKELAPQIIDIHSQHQNLLINTPAFRTSIIDTIAGSGQILEQYGKLYKEYGNIINNLNILRNKQKEAQSEKDYIEYRLQLLKNASINENEAEELELKVKELSNFEEIKNVLSGITYTFYDSENAIISEINNAIRNLEHTTGYLNEANEWKERMQSIEIELNDLLNEISAKNDNLTFDPEEFSTITERYTL
jgi:DNA repair protein RecN (Recombination protein N)